jgi:predicted RNA polymerase sigma factor
VLTHRPDEPGDAALGKGSRHYQHLTGSPVVALNRAVAVAEAGAPEQALELVDSLELGDYRYLHSTRAELLRRLGRHEAARAALEHAVRLAPTEQLAGRFERPH